MNSKFFNNRYGSPLTTNKTQNVFSDRIRNILSNISVSDQEKIKNSVLPDSNLLPGREEMLVDDIDFKASQQQKSPVVVTDKVTIKKRRDEIADKQRRYAEQRQHTSETVIVDVNSNAKRLAQRVDEFIDQLRRSSYQVEDNNHLCRRLEAVRRLCVGFINNLETQLPGRTASLFVTPRQEDDNV